MTVGWGQKSFGELFQLRSGDSLPRKKMVEGAYPVFGGNGIAGSHNLFNREGSNLLIGRVGALCGNVHSVNEPIWLTDNAFQVFFDRAKFDDKFLSYLLEYLDLGQYSRQTAQPVISNSSLKNVEVPYPNSLPEQKRIVAILDEAFASIDQAKANTERNLANARELFDSYLNRVFEEKGEGWSSLRIGELVDCGVLEKPLDGNHGEIHPKKADFVDAGVPFIMASDLKNGLVDQKNCNFISAKQANTLRKGFAKHQDVLLSHKGTIGRTAILSCEKEYVVLTPQGKRPVDTPCSESG